MSDKKPITGKDLTGFIAVNTYKNKPNQPDMKGKLRIGGKEYDFSAWEKEGKPGVYNAVLSDSPIPGQASGRPTSHASFPPPPADASLDDLFS